MSLFPLNIAELHQRFALRPEINGALQVVEQQHNDLDALVEQLKLDFEEHDHAGPTPPQVSYTELLDRPQLQRWVTVAVDGVLAVGADKLRFRRLAPVDMVVNVVRASVPVAPVGSALQFDLKDDGGVAVADIQISNGQLDVEWAVTPTVLILKNSVLQIDFDTVGSTTPGEDLLIDIGFLETP